MQSFLKSLTELSLTKIFTCLQHERHIGLMSMGWVRNCLKLSTELFLNNSTRDLTKRLRWTFSCAAVASVKQATSTYSITSLYSSDVFSFCFIFFPLQCDIPEGGMVPKSLYRTAEELESEEHCLLTDSIYKSANIFKGAPYEVHSQLWPCVRLASQSFIQVWGVWCLFSLSWSYALGKAAPNWKMTCIACLRECSLFSCVSDLLASSSRCWLRSRNRTPSSPGTLMCLREMW